MTELLKVAITLTTAAIANHDVAIPNVIFNASRQFSGHPLARLYQLPPETASQLPQVLNYIDGDP